MGYKHKVKPDFWCYDWYIKCKNDGMTDAEICEYLDIGFNTIHRWKKQLDIPKYAYTFTNAKGRDYDGQRPVPTDD